MEVTIGVIVVGAVFLLAGRELICWYFKINERNELIKEQNELLKQVLSAGEEVKEKEQEIKIQV